MARKPKYSIVGIKPPGKVNVHLNGKFTDIDLHTAPDSVLKQLYADGNPHVILAGQPPTAKGQKPIEVKEINNSDTR